MMTTNHYHDGHKPRRLQNMTMTATAMTATNHDGHKTWPWRPQTMTMVNFVAVIVCGRHCQTPTVPAIKQKTRERWCLAQTCQSEQWQCSWHWHLDVDQHKHEGNCSTSADDTHQETPTHHHYMGCTTTFIQGVQQYVQMIFTRKHLHIIIIQGVQQHLYRVCNTVHIIYTMAWHSVIWSYNPEDLKHPLCY